MIPGSQPIAAYPLAAFDENDSEAVVLPDSNFIEDLAVDLLVVVEIDAIQPEVAR